VYKWLDTALDCGIVEERFWNMTLAEINREIESKKRQLKEKAKEKASFDYILADLIGRSIARIHSSSNKLPSIAETYPSLFVAEEVEEQIQKKKDELSVLRFKQFAQSFNKRFKGENK
jgi:uncharacterized protein Veg